MQVINTKATDKNEETFSRTDKKLIVHIFYTNRMCASGMNFPSELHKWCYMITLGEVQ